MEQETFVDRLTADLNYASSMADTLWRHPKALEQLIRDQRVLQALKDDPALFSVLLIRLPTGMFKPLPFQTDFLRDQNKRIVICSGRQIGKTTMAAAKAIWYAFMHPGVTVLIVSKALRQSMWMFDKVRDMIFWNPILKKEVKIRLGTTRTKIEFRAPINSKIIALPPGHEGDTIRGLTANMLILDEANFIKPEIITSVCTPMITATDGYLIMISTPEYAEHPFMQAFYRAREWGYSRYHFPSGIAPIPTEEAREQFLSEQRSQIPEDEYMREYMAVLPDESDQLLGSKHIHACVEDYELINENQLLEHRFHADYGGYDPGGKKDPAAFVVLKSEGQTARVVFIRERLGEEYGSFSAFIKLAQDRLQLRKIAVDRSGLGQPIVEDLVNMGLPIEPITITEKVRLDLFRWLTVCFEQRKLVIPDNEKLLLQLKSLKQRYAKVADGRTITARREIFHPLNVHDDIVFALALALYVMKKQPEGVFISVH